MATTDNTESAEYRPHVMRTVLDDGTGVFTVAMDDESHRFDVYKSHAGNQVSVTFEESLDYRGQIRTTEPREEVWDILLESEEFKEYISDTSIVNRV